MEGHQGLEQEVQQQGLEEEEQLLSLRPATCAACWSVCSSRLDACSKCLCFLHGRASDTSCKLGVMHAESCCSCLDPAIDMNDACILTCCTSLCPQTFNVGTSDMSTLQSCGMLCQS
jgi:hypothetical protein